MNVWIEGTDRVSVVLWAYKRCNLGATVTIVSASSTDFSRYFVYSRGGREMEGGELHAEERAGRIAHELVG